MLRLLNVFIDAWADHNWALFETALLAEGDREEGWNEDQTARTLKQWGAKDQHGIYQAAGLSDEELKVSYLHFDRMMTSREIAKELSKSPITVRVQLHKAREKLQRLAA